jgi:hypothetical protein
MIVRHEGNQNRFAPRRYHLLLQALLTKRPAPATAPWPNRPRKPKLARVLAAWPSLAGPIKVAILALVSGSASSM